MNEAPELPAVDSSTVYVMPGDSLGEALDVAAAAAPDARNVMICGDRPGAGRSGAETYVGAAGRWWPVDSTRVTRYNVRGKFATDGGRVLTVQRAEPWFDVGVLPGDAAEAMRYVRGVCADFGVRPGGTPGSTGRRMLAESWRRLDHQYEPCPDDIATILRDTSGQGRFEVFPHAANGGDRLAYVDARFQYGACAATELPCGVPEMIDGECADQYAPTWCEVEFVPCGDVGVLPFRMGKAWEWPTGPGPYRSWCSGAELHLARKVGYTATVLRSIVWPGRGLPLASWAGVISRGRSRIDELPVADGVRSAARSALRSILIQTIGGLHGRNDSANVTGVPFASANETDLTKRPADRSGVSQSRPEWTVAIWSLARTRLAKIMLGQRAPLVACTLDGFYVDGVPSVNGDNGKPGTFRTVWERGDWSPITSLADVYALDAVEVEA